MKKTALLFFTVILINYTFSQSINNDSKIMTSLEYLVGEKVLSESLKNLNSDGILYFTDFQNIIQDSYEKDLTWFFDAYCRQKVMPNLLVNYKNDTLYLNWSTPSKASFEMPLEIVVDNKLTLVKMSNGKDKIFMKNITNLDIDPTNSILKKSEWKEKKELRDKLNAIKGLTLWEIPARDHFSQAYHLTIKQPLDHFDKTKGTFKQHMYLSHTSETKAFLMETCGYEAYDYTKEIAKMTQGNQLIIEYRYFGNSKPDTNDWQFLRNKQAIEDYHHINTAFKNIYSGKWISSGISKGGANCITYRSQYPNDVDVTVPYVAPIALKREDERTTTHINTIGESWCRDSTYAFQRRLLERRDEIIPLLKAYAKKKGYTYSIGYETALEYAAYEYTFSFWQWYGKCDGIPGKNATAQEIFDHVNYTVGWSFYNDQTIEKLYPSYYQHMVELGYYGFQKKHIYDLIKVVKNPDNMFFVADAENIPEYNGDYMQKVWDYATNKGNNFIYIYGEYDTWTACSITPSQKLNSLKMVKKGATHGVRINDFSTQEKSKIYQALSEWLNIKIHPLE